MCVLKYVMLVRAPYTQMEGSVMRQGLFIVIYGINNLGKTTQAKLLVERLQAAGEQVIYIKYPIYDLEPSGPIINGYLREGNPSGLSPREAQIIYVLNRTQFQPMLEKHLSEGTYVVAEDYTGTGIAWGVGAGVERDFLLRLNRHLRVEDLTFLFDGDRFSDGIESGHIHEEDDELTADVRRVHHELADELGWKGIDANGSREEIHERIWAEVAQIMDARNNTPV